MLVSNFLIRSFLPEKDKKFSWLDNLFLKKRKLKNDSMLEYQNKKLENDSMLEYHFDRILTSCSNYQFRLFVRVRQ